MPPMTKVWTGSAVRPRTSHPFNMLKLNWGNRTPPNHSPAIVATWVATKAAITALFPALLPIRYLTPESDSSICALAPKDRGRLLLKLARMIQEHGEALAQVEARNSGHPIRDVRRFDLVRTVDWFEYFGGMATKVQGDVIPSSFTGVLNYTLREPLGVVGQIVPWNFPLMFVAWNIAPALAAGNTVVLKPA